MNDSSAGTWKHRARDERGQTLVEYALIIAVVSLGSLVALGFLSGKIQELFSKAGNSIENVTVASGGSGSGSGSGGGTPPPVPTLTGGPAEGTSGNSATYTNPSFSFTSAGATSFECSIDGGTFGTCTSPTSMGPGLGTGAHSFAVQATSGGGTSAPATRSWTVTAALSAPVYSSGGNLYDCGASGTNLGSCSEGETIRVTTAVYTGNPTPTVTYQWKTNTDGGDAAACDFGAGGTSNGWSNVSGATGQSYTLPNIFNTTDSVGVRITATNSEGTVVRDRCTTWNG